MADLARDLITFRQLFKYLLLYLGFEGEVRVKYGELAYDMFCEVFCYLPLAHVINNKVYVVHGGLFSQDGVTLAQIRKIHRVCEPPIEGKTILKIGSFFLRNL